MRATVSSLCLISLAASLLLTGCALKETASPASATYGMTVTGSVHGGQQPVSGARIYLIEINAPTQGYGATSIVNATLANGTAAPADSTGRYVTTDANGSYTVTGSYTCAAGGAVYVLALGGNPGLGSGVNNPALAEMAPVGTCNGSAPFASGLNVQVTEESTVAAVYGLAGYLVGPAALTGNSTTLAHTGVANAFGTALGLVNQSTGTALATTAAGATVPVAKMNLLADILASCVNSDGTGTPCATLFANSTADGTSSGAQPTETVTALLNIAHHPASNLAALYALVTPSAPYQPVPATQPADFTLALTYPSFTSNGSIFRPNLPSITAAGRVALPGEFLAAGTNADNGGGFLVLDPQGTPVVVRTRLQDAAGNDTREPQTLAIDPNGAGWSANSVLNGTVGGQFFRANLTSGAITNLGNAGVNGITQSVVSDATGQIFQADNANDDQFVLEYSNGGALIYNWLQSGNWIGTAIDAAGYVYGASTVQGRIGSQYTGNINSSVRLVTNTLGPNSLALAAGNRLWVTDGSANALTLYGLSYGGQLSSISSRGTFTGGGLSFNTAVQALVPVVVDGSSAAWVPNFAGSSVSQFSIAGQALSPAASGSFTGGFQTGCPSKGVAVDGSGNLWVTCDIGSSLAGTPLVEFLGAATPVATPILPGQQGIRP